MSALHVGLSVCMRPIMHIYEYIGIYLMLFKAHIQYMRICLHAEAYTIASQCSHLYLDRAYMYHDRPQ